MSDRGAHIEIGIFEKRHFGLSVFSSQQLLFIALPPGEDLGVDDAREIQISKEAVGRYSTLIVGINR